MKLFDRSMLFSYPCAMEEENKKMEYKIISGKSTGSGVKKEAR